MREARRGAASWPQRESLLGRHTVLVMCLLSLGAVLSLSVYTGLVLRGHMAGQERDFVERLNRHAVMAASLVTGEELQAYREPGDVDIPEYVALKARLKDFSDHVGIMYVYYLRFGEDGRIRYIVDNDYDEETRVGLDTPSEDPAIESGAEFAWRQGLVASQGLGVYSEGWEGIISSYAPVMTADGRIEAVAGVDVDDRLLRLANSRMAMYLAIQVLAVLLVAACGLASIVSSRASARRAEAARLAKTSFLARMSHEIRTPMAAVMSLAELARREYGSPEALERIGGIAKAGAGLVAVINDILDIAKVEQGGVVLKEGAYSSASLVSDAAAVVGVRLCGRPVDLEVHADPELPSVLYGDGGRVKQIMLNLLNNAVKYTSRGRVRLEVRAEPVRLRPLAAKPGDGRGDGAGPASGTGVPCGGGPGERPEGAGQGARACGAGNGPPSVGAGAASGGAPGADGRACVGGAPGPDSPGRGGEQAAGGGDLPEIRLLIRVEDTGVGIRAPDLKRIFREFPQSDPAGYGSLEGSGLGLAIARSLARAMGGDISAESEYGTGSAFTAAVVQRVADTRPLGELDPSLPSPQEAPLASITAPEAHVLVVDDLPSNLIVAEGLLAPYQVRVSTASSGREAVLALERRDYDLVLLDHMMPGMDGMETVMVIRTMEDERLATLPVVAFTANAVTGMREFFMDNGFDDFMAKPIEVAELDRIMRTWIPASKRVEPPPAGEGGAAA